MHFSVQGLRVLHHGITYHRESWLPVWKRNNCQSWQAVVIGDFRGKHLMLAGRCFTHTVSLKPVCFLIFRCTRRHHDRPTRTKLCMSHKGAQTIPHKSVRTYQCDHYRGSWNHRGSGAGHSRRGVSQSIDFISIVISQYGHWSLWFDVILPWSFCKRHTNVLRCTRLLSTQLLALSVACTLFAVLLF